VPDWRRHALAAGAKASFGWVLGFELFNSIGFSNVLPVGLALYARASPRGSRAQ